MIYLHIGRHKTGTTAIQRFLGANREHLARRNIIYPSTEGPEEGHHGVWMALQQRTRPVAQPLALPWLRAVNLEEFTRSLHAAPDAIVSSEAFQGLNPQDIVDVFPPQMTTVVIYLREQVDYLLTSYAQEVQSNIELRSFDEFAAETAIDYRSFLDAWAAVFGEEKLIVRVYDRKRLKGGSTVDDFVEAIGLSSMGGLETLNEDPNVSLSALLTVAKKLLNRVVTPEEHRSWSLYTQFARLAALDTSPQRRVSIPASLSLSLYERHRADNEYVSRRFFGSSRDVFRYVAANTTDLPLADSEVITMLARLKSLDRMEP